MHGYPLTKIDNLGLRKNLHWHFDERSRNARLVVNTKLTDPGISKENGEKKNEDDEIEKAWFSVKPWITLNKTQSINLIGHFVLLSLRSF